MAAKYIRVVSPEEFQISWPEVMRKNLRSFSVQNAPSLNGEAQGTIDSTQMGHLPWESVLLVTAGPLLMSSWGGKKGNRWNSKTQSNKHTHTHTFYKKCRLFLQPAQRHKPVQRRETQCILAKKKKCIVGTPQHLEWIKMVLYTQQRQTHWGLRQTPRWGSRLLGVVLVRL